MMSGVRAQRLAMRRGEEQAREEARLDELTGIGNRRAFEETLDYEIARSSRLKGPLSIAMADIDSFKLINDEWGHLEGDQCLRRVSDSIVGELRTPDRCFRWGGDEFAIVLPGTDGAGAAQLADRLQNKVAAACRRPDNEAIQIRVGTAELDDGMSRQDLLAAADLALMAAKSAQE
jgi:diguanylate cyclase (GGDEF)-like protein